MADKFLTEAGWKAVAQKFKLKDNGLAPALSAYGKLPANKHAERLKGISAIRNLTAVLLKNQDVNYIPAAVNYLAEVAEAAAVEQGAVMKAGAAADKAGGNDDKKAAAEAKKRELDENACHAQLLAAFQKLKSAKDFSYEFIICDAKPHCGLMIAKHITPQHKAELSRLAGGSKRFLSPGTCRFADGKFTFSMDQPPAGLAKKLQDSIQNSTGRKLPIAVGADFAGGDEPPGR